MLARAGARVAHRGTRTALCRRQVRQASGFHDRDELGLSGV